MNSFSGKISALEAEGDIIIIKVDMSETLTLKAIIIDVKDFSSSLQTEQNVNVLFKETEVIIAKGSTENLSLQNKIPGKVTEIEKGKLLGRLVISSPLGDVVAIISMNAVQALALNVGDEVTAMVKLNEVILSEA